MVSRQEIGKIKYFNFNYVYANRSCTRREQTVSTHEPYMRCVDAPQTSAEQINDPANTLSPIREDAAPNTFPGRNDQSQSKPQPAIDFDSAPAILELKQKLAEQEKLIHLLTATIGSNHYTTMKYAKQHSSELTSIYQHVAEMSERLTAFGVEQRAEAQVSRSRQQEIYELFMQNERVAKKFRASLVEFDALMQRHEQANVMNATTHQQQHHQQQHHVRTPSDIQMQGRPIRESITPPLPQMLPHPPRTSSSHVHNQTPASPTRSPVRSMSPLRSLDRFVRRRHNSGRDRGSKEKRNSNSEMTSPVRNSKHSSTASSRIAPSPKRRARSSTSNAKGFGAPTSSDAAMKARKFVSMLDQQAQHSGAQLTGSRRRDQRSHQHRQDAELVPRDPADLFEYEYSSSSQHQQQQQQQPSSPEKRMSAGAQTQSSSGNASSSGLGGRGIRAEYDDTSGMFRLYREDGQRAYALEAKQMSSQSVPALPPASQPIARGESKSLALLGMPDEADVLGGGGGVAVSSGMDGGRGKTGVDIGNSGSAFGSAQQTHGKGVLRDYFSSVGKAVAGRKSE